MKKIWIQAVFLLALVGLSTNVFAQTSQGVSSRGAKDGTETIDVTPDSQGDAQVDSAERRVAFLLSAIHGIPPKAAFDAIPGARDIVERIALNFDAWQQRMAIAALAYYPSDATFQTLEYLLKSKKSSRGLKMTVLDQIGRVYKTDKALKILGKYLNDDDIYVRIGAIYGLSSFNTDASFSLLRARYAVEKDSLVLDNLVKYGVRIN